MNDLIYDTIRADGRKKAAGGQTVIECIASCDKEIKKILGVSCECVSAAAEALSGEAKISGSVNFKAVYLSVENTLESFDYFVDFTQSVEGDVLPGMKTETNVSILDIETQASNATRIKMSAVADIMVETFISEEVKLLTGAGEDCLKRTKNVTMERRASHGEGTFDISEEFEASCGVAKVLITDISAIICDYKCGIDNVLVGGEAAVNMVYAGAAGEIITKSFIMPFSEEVAIPGAFAGQKACGDVKVAGMNVVIGEGEASKIVKVELKLKISAETYEESDAVLICDLYSPCCELETTMGKKTMTRFCQSKFMEEKINATASLDVEMAGIKDIIATGASRNNIAAVIPKEGAVVVEGVVCGAVIYEDAEGEINSVQVELPYSLEMKADVNEKSIVKGKGIVSNIYARARREREIEAIAELKFSVEIFECDELVYIQEVKEGEVRQVNQCALSMYITSKGETMWEVAKALGMRPEEILKQNPEISEPLAENSKLYVYRKLPADF